MIIKKSDLQKRNIENFIKENRESLQGSALFTRNSSLISKMVCHACQGKCEVKGEHFIPSHIASIYEDVGEDGNVELYLLDIKPPISTRQKLIDYLNSSKDDFVIFERFFPIDIRQFNNYMKKRVGLIYGLLSAVQSIFKNFTIKHGMHCSENYIYAYNQQGFMFDINANKSTPDSLLHYLINTEYKLNEKS